MRMSDQSEKKVDGYLPPPGAAPHTLSNRPAPGVPCIPLHASGIGLRELARNLEYRPGPCSHARNTKDGINAITPMQSTALTMRERAERHMERMAGVTDNVLPHLESVKPAEIFDSARNLERFDYVARRNYGLDEQSAVRGPINFHVLMASGQFPERPVEAVEPSE
jgi:hypothetical protein